MPFRVKFAPFAPISANVIVVHDTVNIGIAQVPSHYCSALLDGYYFIFFWRRITVAPMHLPFVSRPRLPLTVKLILLKKKKKR